MNQEFATQMAARTTRGLAGTSWTARRAVRQSALAAAGGACLAALFILPAAIIASADGIRSPSSGLSVHHKDPNGAWPDFLHAPQSAVAGSPGDDQPKRSESETVVGVDI